MLVLIEGKEEDKEEVVVSADVEYIYHLRARRALSLFKDVPLRTRRTQSPSTLYSDSPLLVLNGTFFSTDS